MKDPSKLLSICITVLSICVIVLASVQLLGFCDDAINVYEPLLGCILLLQAIQNWKKNRTVAIFSLCGSLFIFGVAIFIIF